MRLTARTLFVLLLGLAFCAALAPTAALGVPPSPELALRAKTDSVLAARISKTAKTAAAKRIDAPAVDRVVVATDAAGAPHVGVVKAPASSGQLRTLAILVEFSDREAQVAPAFFDGLLFNDTYGPGSLRGYYKEVSYGGLSVTTSHLPSDVGWITLPHTAEYYAGEDNGMGTYPRNSQGMVVDAVSIANGAVDFSDYDNDGDGYVDNLLIIHAGTGAELSGEEADIWSHAWGLAGSVLVDGVRIAGYSTEPEYWVAPGDMTVGVYAHEVGHVLGLPDLYDYDGTSEGVGEWSLMAGGSWNGATSPGGDSPARPDAWSSARLGWLEPATVSSAPGVKSLPTVGTAASGTAYRVYPNGATTGDEYFLVENRQKTGTDSYLPGDGLLVWHIDESLADEYGVNDDEFHKCVDLEEADAIGDLDRADNRGTAGDPFPGTSDNREFTVSSEPDSRTYLGADSLVSIDTISTSQATMSARIGVGVPGALGGTVSDSGGGVAGVCVWVPGYLPATTGAGGVYALPGIAPGLYDVTYSKTGYASRTVAVTVSAGSTTTQDVTLAVGENDDDIPGVPVPAGAIRDTLNETGDRADVFKIHLEAGEVLTLSMRGAANTDFNIHLFAPDAVSISGDEPVGRADDTVYPDVLQYVVPATGEYYIAAVAFDGAGPYSITYSKTRVGTLSGTVSDSSGPLQGATVTAYSDLSDGDAFTTTAANGTYSLAGLAPGDYAVVYEKDGYRGRMYEVTIVADATTTRDVTLVAIEPDDDIPGIVAPASPIAGTLDEDLDPVDVFRITLKAGDSLTATLNGAATTDFDIYLFAPDARSVYDDDAIDYSNTEAYPETFKFTAPVAGTYYLCAHAYRGAGTYTLTYRVTSPVLYRPVYRFRNLRNGFYLWSADEAEKASIIANLSSTWKYEGVAYKVNVANTQNRSPLWRFINLRGGHYLYSADANEKATIIADLSATWKYEGPSYHVSTSRSGSPVWRFRNRADGTYLYSADVNEKDNIVANLSAVWQLEGPAYYLAP